MGMKVGGRCGQRLLSAMATAGVGHRWLRFLEVGMVIEV